MWWLLLLLPCVEALCNTSNIHAVHGIVERVQMMQGQYHVLDALEEYTWYYEKLWTGEGFPSAEDESPHIELQNGPVTTYDIFSLTRARFRSQEEGDRYCNIYNDTSLCVGNQARGTSLVPVRYYGIDVAAPVLSTNQTFRIILGARIYSLSVHWDLNTATGSMSVVGRSLTMFAPNVGGVRCVFNTLTGFGTLYGAPAPFRNYLVGQSLYDTHLYRGGTCGEDASTICPGALTEFHVPCNGHGRCESSCQCICDKAPHEMIMEALVVGDSAPNTPDGLLRVQDNPSRTPYRGEGCEITCPGYDGFSMESVCSGRGTCGDGGQCICDYGYVGDNCQFQCPGFSGTQVDKICSKKGSCDVTDISSTDFRSSDSRNRERFLTVLRNFYARCHTFIAGHPFNDGLLFPGDACTDDSQCASRHCDTVCVGSEAPAMYVALQVDIVGATAEIAPADPRRWCTLMENCLGFVNQTVYLGSFLYAESGTTTIYVKNPFTTSLRMRDEADGSDRMLSYIMSGRESYDRPCEIPSQQRSEQPWVYRPFIYDFEQRYDEPLANQTWEGMGNDITVVADISAPTSISIRTCEIHPDFVLRCPTCSCFYGRVHGFFDGPNCEQCARGYATETCNVKCPGFDGKNIATACSGMGLCNMGKDGTGKCLCGGTGGDRFGDRVLPIYRDVDAPYGGGTHDFCAVWRTQPQCDNQMGCVWNMRCLPKRSQTVRAVPSPPLLPFEPTYFIGEYREFSTFLWPQTTPDVVLDLEQWSAGVVTNSENEVQCVDFPGVDCDPSRVFLFYNTGTFNIGTSKTLADMCPKDSVDLTELAFVREKDFVLMEKYTGVWLFADTYDDVPASSAEECKTICVERSDCTAVLFYGSCQVFNTYVTMNETHPVHNIAPADLTSYIKTSRDVTSLFKACCRCGGGQRAHGLPTSALKVASSYDASCTDTWKNSCSTFPYCRNGGVATFMDIDWNAFRDRDGITPDIGCCACGGGTPTDIPAECGVPVYETLVDEACTDTTVTSAASQSACEATCSIEVTCTAYGWDGSCTHSTSLDTVQGVGNTCYRKQNFERCKGWQCADAVGAICTSCDGDARESCCQCGGGVYSNAPVVPFRVRANPETTKQIFPTSVSQIERRTASKINFPYEFAGVDTIRQQRRRGTSVCPDCPDADCNKCPNDCALCINGFSGYNCGDRCGTCVLGGTCVSEPTDGVTLCDCPSSSSSSRHNCCPNGFVLLSNDQALTRPTQVGGISAGLSIYGAFSDESDPRSVNYFDGNVTSNIVSGCYPCPGLISSAEVCLHPFCENDLVEVPDRCRTDAEYDVGYDNLWKTLRPASWKFHTRSVCSTYGNSFATFREAERACINDPACTHIQEWVVGGTYYKCNGFTNGVDKYYVVWEEVSLGTCINTDTTFMRNWRGVYAASSGYASNVCNGHLDQCMIDFNGQGIFADRTVCGQCFLSAVDETLAHGRDCKPCGYGTFGELPLGESFSTTCYSCPSGRGVPGFVGVHQDYDRSETAPCTSGISDAFTCNQDASCLCYTSDAVYIKTGFHKAPGYRCVGVAIFSACPISLNAFGCYMRVGDQCATFASTDMELSTNDTAWVNSAMTGGPCQSCPVGRFNDGSSSICQTCGKGTYQNEVGKLGCKSCPYGWYTKKGAGADGHDSSADCISCAAGQFMEQRFMDTNACEICPTGWGTDGDSRWFCSHCEPGQYQFRNMYDWNTFISENGTMTMPTNDCTDCAVGRFQSQEGAQTCSLCPSGKYEDEEGSSGCKQCTGGEIPNSERTACVSCPVGFVSISGQSGCSQCAPGKYSEGGTTGGSTCKDCQTGKYNPTTGAGSCLDCEVGKYMDETGFIFGCKTCPGGTYGDEESLTACKTCPPNMPGSTVGSQSINDCRACQSGRSVGSSGCDVCAVGQYQDQENQATCKYCPTVETFGVSGVISTSYTEMTYESELSMVYMAQDPNDYSNTIPQISNGPFYDFNVPYQYSYELTDYLQHQTFKVMVACPDNLKYDCCFSDYYYTDPQCTDPNYGQACPVATNFAYCCDPSNSWKFECRPDCAILGNCQPWCTGPYIANKCVEEPAGFTPATSFVHVYYPPLHQSNVYTPFILGQNNALYPVDQHRVPSSCTPYFTYTFDSSYTETMVVPAAQSTTGVEETITLSFASRKDREFKCMYYIYFHLYNDNHNMGNSLYDANTDVLTCYTYNNCILPLEPDANRRTYMSYNWYNSQNQFTAYSLGSLEGSSSASDCGCTSDQYYTGTLCKDCGNNHKNDPTYHQTGQSGCQDMTTTRFRMGCLRDGNSQYTGVFAMSENEKSYNLNNEQCLYGGDGNSNNVNDRINRIIDVSPKHNHRVTFTIYGESNCQTFKSSFTVGCSGSIPNTLYFQDGSTVYSTTNPGYGGSKFDASCLKVKLDSC